MALRATEPRPSPSFGVALVLALLSVLVAAPLAGAAPRNSTCQGKTATIVGHGDIHGSAHADVIVGSRGRDQVVGGGGDDLICTGAGDDTIEGREGSDKIEAGPGNDQIEGGNGSDQVIAGPGEDVVDGNRGNDQLYGEGGTDVIDAGLGDDTLDGGPGGGDELIGGIGTDHLFGGEGDGDVLEGNLGTDTLDGGPGAHDVASYALAGRGGVFTGGIGVTVDLAAGTAYGDGDDTLTGIEDAVGSPFADKIAGDAEANYLFGGGGEDELMGVGPGDVDSGGTGFDRCLGADSVDGCEVSGADVGTPAAEVADRAFYEGRHPPIFQVDLPGGPADGSLTGVVEYNPNRVEKTGMQVHASFAEGAWIIVEQGLTMAVGEGCVLSNPETARCPIDTVPTGLFLDGSEGDDVIVVEESVPSTVSSILLGGRGTDTLAGGTGDDSLDGGGVEGLSGGALYGGRGDDALTGAGLMEGGSGSDLLIAEPCGQTVDGGPGLDSVSFARAQERGVIASLGGYVADMPFGPYPSFSCPIEHLPGQLWATKIETSVERIEGSPYPDILSGDSGPNVILGRGGDDEIYGGAGDDFLVGGTGVDSLFGESGADRLYARDEARDRTIDCAAPPRDHPPTSALSHGDVATVDPIDPGSLHCAAPVRRSRIPRN